MEVFEIEVCFRRTRQPRDYEAAEAKVGLKAALADGEDHDSAAKNLLATAAARVYEVLGMQQAVERVAQAPQPEPEAETKPAPQPEPEAEAEEPEERAGGADFDDKPTTYRGKNADAVANRLISEVKAGKPLDEDEFNRLPKRLQDEVKKATAPSGSVVEPPKKGNGADFDDAPAAEEVKDEFGFNTPAEPEVKPEDLTDTELLRLVSEVARAKGSPEPVKKLIADFDVARIGELPQDKRPEFVKRLREL